MISQRDHVSNQVFPGQEKNKLDLRPQLPPSIYMLINGLLEGKVGYAKGGANLKGVFSQMQVWIHTKKEI